MLPRSRFFPPVESAADDGLLMVGGRLTPAWLLDAYAHGIFPWPFTGSVSMMAWWSPDPRAIIELDGLHVSRRLARTCRSGRFQVTIDRDFAAVVCGCATAQDRDGATWITPDMTAAYTRLFNLGHAHSIEVWQDGELAGGVYGVALGGLFAGESMFYHVRDASKVALVHLVGHLRARGYGLFDIQQLNPHTASLGGSEISRSHYLKRLGTALALRTSFGSQLEPIKL